MSQSVPFDLDPDIDAQPFVSTYRAAPADPGWSPRRKLLCFVALGMAAWMLILSPVVFG